MELAELLLEEARVAIVPGEAFGAPGYARLSYALGDDDLAEGIARIAKLLQEAW
jgi:aspartate aminotransferase